MRSLVSLVIVPDLDIAALWLSCLETLTGSRAIVIFDDSSYLDVLSGSLLIGRWCFAIITCYESPILFLCSVFFLEVSCVH